MQPILTAARYENDVRLTSILYFHQITEKHMAGTVAHSFCIFRKICGRQFAEKVIFVTTMWDRIQPEQGEQRELELSKRHWLMLKGAKTARFFQSNENSAQNIVEPLIESGTAVTRFQEEIVSEKRRIHETEAGQELHSQKQKVALLWRLIWFLKRKPGLVCI